MKLFALLLCAIALYAQPPVPAAPAALSKQDDTKQDEQEQLDLSKAIAEAGASGIDYIRALERHLGKYPETKRRAEIEKALAKSAMDANDHARIILYGERVLRAEPQSDDVQLMDRVTRALLDADDKDSARRALGYAKRYEAALDAMRPKAAESHMSEGDWTEEIDKGRARVLALEARATGNLGGEDAALQLAKKSWDTFPNAESAREVGKWLVKLGRQNEALEYYADSFSMSDARTTESDRLRDRARLAEIYTALNGSEKGLGDLTLQAFDRTSALKRDRLAALKRKDPNAGATELLDFTLPGADGRDAISLASLKGKTVVMDFWATWCGPCKVQHPLIEKIRQNYQSSGNVVFLSVNSESDHSVVAPFLKEMHWSGRTYYDAGIARLLNVSSIPTVIILDRNGKISSRMIGFIPERFEEMLTERIEETRAN